MLRLGLVLAVGLLGAARERTAAAAQPDAGAPEAPPAAAEDAGEAAEAYRRLSEAPGRAVQIVSTLAFGTGLRFNNPYRLQTQLGDTPESLSLTSGYLDLGVAAAFGPADGLQHGGALHFSMALSGVAQQAIAPSYLLAYRPSARLLTYGRLGASILTAPDANVGGELAAGLGFFLTAKLGFSAEIVGDLFYGAATYEAAYTVYPVISAQLGILFDHEILP